ncbi:MAG: hypothetical protein RJB01_1863 [Actinomycetota bacterium]|jgi:hypothetical protein
MNFAAAAEMANEAATHGGTVPAYVFGLFAFGVLGALLVITLMLNVDR